MQALTYSSKQAQYPVLILVYIITFAAIPNEGRLGIAIVTVPTKRIDIYTVCHKDINPKLLEPTNGVWGVSLWVMGDHLAMTLKLPTLDLTT